MPTIIKRGNVYLARVRKQGFRPVSRSFTRLTDAKAWGRRIEADMQSGRWVDEAKPAPSLREAIGEYRRKVAPTLKGERDYAYAFKELEALDVAACPVNHVKPAELADWRDALAARGLKPSTIVRRLGLLSAVLSWCQKERGWISDNPMRQVRKPVVRDARTRTLDDDEARYLGIATRGARAAWLPDAMAVLIQTAMRRSELVGLLCADVDLEASVAQLQDTKNGEARDVPLCPDAKAALGRLIETAKIAKRATVLPINDPEAISFAFRRAVVRAQERYREDCCAARQEPAPGFLEGVRLHDLRHHAISTWARTGSLSLMELMKISGHKSPRMLARYAHISAEQLAAKMASLNSNPITTQGVAA